MSLRRLSAVAAVLIALAIVGFVGYAHFVPAGPDPVHPVSGVPADIPAGMSRGEYLAIAADCVACHTVQGGKPYAGARPFKLPFGTIYATNLTPDDETGIGRWTDDQFVEAVRAGVGPNGHLYPAMPYTSYAEMSREDVLAIKEYLFTLAPIKLKTPESTLGFPFNQRWGMAFWNTAFFREKRYQPDPKQDDVWNRGAYLAGALGHCGECHTPRNIGMAMSSRAYLSGTNIEGWTAYNTTSDAAYGIGAWTDEQLSSYLSTGHAPGRSSASGPMAEVVEHSLQYLTPSDITALARYLRSVAPSDSGIEGSQVDSAPVSVASSSALLPAGRADRGLRHGERLFEGDCASCHQWNGSGRQTPYASLAGSRAVNDPTGTALVQVLIHGTSIRIANRSHVMPGFGSSYTDDDIADVANYVLSHFGAKTGTVTADKVADQREQH